MTEKHCSPDSETTTLREFKKDIARHFEEVVKAIDGTFSSRCGAFKLERDTWGVHLSISAAELLVEALRDPAQAAPRRCDDHMTRARRLVEDHIESYGMVPHPDKIKEAIAEQSQESFDLGFRAAGGSGPAVPQAAREALKAAKEFLDDEFSDCNDLNRKVRLSALCDKVDAALSRPQRPEDGK